MRRLLWLIVIGALVMSASLCWAEIPHLINYQGMLTDNEGNPLNEPRDLTFTIYDAPTNGTALWTESHTAVPIEDGLFNVILGGATTPIPDSVFDELERHLGIKVGADPELTPRIQLTSVGYAYRALVADSALSATPGSGSTWSVTDSVVYTNKYWGIARGGAGNVLYGDSVYSHVNLGVFCTTGTNGEHRYHCVVGGGKLNSATDHYTTVGGGVENRATEWAATIAGGYWNLANGYCASVGGGEGDTASADYATVAGGTINRATASGATVGGGYDNLASSIEATVAGGSNNKASGSVATVGGGSNNTASGNYATVVGGYSNTASGNYSLATGYLANAIHSGSFVWADTNGGYFSSTGTNQFLIRASGGVGIGTSSPTGKLDVVGNHIRLAESTDPGAKEIRLRTDGAAVDVDVNNADLFIKSNTGNTILQVFGGNVGIGTNSPTQKLDVNGTARLRGISSGSGNPVLVDGNGVLYEGTWPSSKRYKENIRNIDIDPEKILELQTVRFKWKESGKEDVGLIAEDVEKAVPDLVIYDDQGRPNGVRYDKLALYLLVTVKELKAENVELKKKMEALDSKE